VTPYATPLAERAAALRAEFDLAFTRPASIGEDQVELLCLGVGHRRFAVRVADVAGLVADRQVTRLPGGPPSQLGIASVRRTVVAVHDLGTLLGERTDTSPRWLLLTASDPQVGLAFERFETHARVPRSAMPAAPSGSPGTTTAGVVTIRSAAHPLLDVPGLVGRLSAPPPVT
jgi:chemotaxis signal transduction protein